MSLLALTLSKIMGGATTDHNTSLTSPDTGAAILTMSKIFSYSDLGCRFGRYIPRHEYDSSTEK